MDQTIHVFGIKILTFISVFMIITGVRFWILNRKKAGYPAIVPTSLQAAVILQIKI